MTPQEELKARLASRPFQTSKANYDGEGTLTAFSTVPEREPYKAIEGFGLARRSSLVDAEGNVIQSWVIEKPEDAQRWETFKLAMEELKRDLPRSPVIAEPSHTMDEYLAGYPVGDHHIGMLAWGDEVGDSYDIKISESLLERAGSHLIGTMLPATHCVVAFPGHFLHYDRLQAVTPQHKNLLDADGRAGKMVPAAIRAVRRLIEQAAERHQFVHVIIEFGNHDPMSSLWLMNMMAVLYEDNPRITVDTSPAMFHYYRWEKVLLATCHGDKLSMKDMPLIMAADRAKDWGETDHRYVWTGHIHTHNAMDVKGVAVESFRVLPPTDAWAHQKGYRPIRDMKAVIFHKDFGEQARYSFNPEMMNA